MQNHEPRHGGKRAGAGRKPLAQGEPTQIITVRMPQSQVDWLAQQPVPAAEIIRRLIQQAMESQPY